MKIFYKINKMNKKYLYYTIASIFLFSCSKDDDNSIAVSRILIDPITLTLITGETETLTAIVQPNDATNQTITWTSNNQEVVVVDKSGNVTAKTHGTAIITATIQDEKINTDCIITVLPAGKTLFTHNYEAMIVGNVFPLRMFMTQDDFENTSFEWNSDNNAVAMVDEHGIVRGLSEGIATITCTAYSGKIHDSISISFIDLENTPFLYKLYTGVLSYEDGEEISSSSTMVGLACTDGIDFSYCFFDLTMSITYKEKNIHLSLLYLNIITENNNYSIVGETTYGGNPITISGMINMENQSVFLKINVAMERPLNLFFQGSIKSDP